MYDHTKLVSKNVFNELLSCLPSNKQRRFGRRRIAKETLLCGILQVLVNGVSWNKIAWCGCSYVSCWRYIHELQRRTGPKYTDPNNGSIGRKRQTHIFLAAGSTGGRIYGEPGLKRINACGIFCPPYGNASVKIKFLPHRIS